MRLPCPRSHLPMRTSARCKAASSRGRFSTGKNESAHRYATSPSRMKYTVRIRPIAMLKIAPAQFLMESKQVGRCIADEILDLGADLVGIDLVGKGEPLQLVEQAQANASAFRGPNSCRSRMTGRKSKKSKSRQSPRHSKQQDQDGAAFERPPAPGLRKREVARTTGVSTTAASALTYSRSRTARSCHAR